MITSSRGAPVFKAIRSAGAHDTSPAAAQPHFDEGAANADPSAGSTDGSAQ